MHSSPLLRCAFLLLGGFAVDAFALVSGKVLDRSGRPLAGVVVHQVVADASDTTDAQGTWSLGTATVGVREASPSEISATLRGSSLRVMLPESSPILVEVLTVDGRRLPVLRAVGQAGSNDFALDPSSLRPSGRLRIQTNSGIVLVSSVVRRTDLSELVAFRSAEVLDTLVFGKVGYETVRRPMVAGQDTFLVVLDSALATPSGLWTSILSSSASSVAWSAVTGATSYQVRRCSYSGSVCTDTSVTNPGYVQHGLAEGSIVRVRVRALRQDLSSAWSEELVVHRPPAAPLSRDKIQDTLPAFALPGLVTVTVPGWRSLRSVRAYSEATPFQDTLLPPDSTIVLRVGGNALPVFDTAWIRVVALDSLGDSGVCRIRVTERSLSVVLMPRDTVVAYGTTSLTVRVLAESKTGIASVTIGGNLVSGSAGAFQRDVALVVGKNAIPVLVTDLAGAIARDTFQVVRLRDSISPSIVRNVGVGGGPRAWVKTFNATFTIIDESSVRSVTINGTPVTPTGNTYTRSIPLEAGSNRVVVTAVDGAGNVTTDSFTIETFLKDRDGNTLKFGRMLDGRMWTLQNLHTIPSASSVGTGKQASCVKDSCAKYGRQYSWAMAMDLPATCDEVSCAQKDSLSHQGLCPSGWHLPTGKEWSNLVAYAATGASDSIGASRLMSTTAEGKWLSWSDYTCAPASYTERNFSGTNQYGFTLLPTNPGAKGGPCGSGGDSFARYWRATEATGTTAATTVWNGKVEHLTSPKTSASVLRCVAN
jgi:uncharacterized protein (TIGR02145 family)